MAAFVLYLLTGVATAVPVARGLMGAGGFAPVPPLGFVSLAGSLLLLVAALMAPSQRRVAARVALSGLAALWCCYLPVSVVAARAFLTDQQLTLTVLMWTPSSSELSLCPALSYELPVGEMERLKAIGLGGRVFVEGGGTFGHGAGSHATLVFQHPVRERTYLAEPDGVSVVYVQYGDNWKLYPPDARTLRRRIIIAPAEPLPDGETQNSVIAEISTGAGQGFGVWPWPSPDASCGPGGK